MAQTFAPTTRKTTGEKQHPTGPRPSFFWPTERVRGEVGSVRGPMILRILRDRLLGFFDGAEGADAELAADPLLDVVHQYPVTCCFSRSLGETKGHMKKKHTQKEQENDVL